MHYRLTRLQSVFFVAVLLFATATGLWAAVGGRLASNNPRAIALYEEGLKLAGQDRFAEAIDKLKQAILADSNFIQAHLRYMDAFKGQGRAGEVEGMYRNKVTANPENPVYHYLLGRALGDMTAKRAAFQKALQCDSTFYWAPYGIGGSYYLEGRLEEAVLYLNRALRLNPQMVDAVRLLGEVYMDKEMHLQARDQFEQAIKLDPGDIANYLLLGQAYSRMDRVESAEKAFQSAARIAPQNPQPWYFLGLLYELYDNKPKALEAYGKFLELGPKEELAPLVRRNIENLEKPDGR